MDIKQEESNIDGSRHRKFGLPDWMVNNIERLNFATDFEQYACSPPETDGFLTEYNESKESPLINESLSSITTQSKAVHDVHARNCIQTKVDSEAQLHKLLIKPNEHLPPVHNSISNIKNEEFLSSPDSTPCVTPEPSPVVRRKMSNPSDTVITNPGRWFYLGKVNHLQKKVNESDSKKRECNNKYEQRSSMSTSKSNDSLLSARKNGIKLMISNFDLNAVSPTSW